MSITQFIRGIHYSLNDILAILKGYSIFNDMDIDTGLGDVIKGSIFAALSIDDAQTIRDVALYMISIDASKALKVLPQYVYQYPSILDAFKHKGVNYKSIPAFQKFLTTHLIKALVNFDMSKIEFLIEKGFDISTKIEYLDTWTSKWHSVKIGTPLEIAQSMLESKQCLLHKLNGDKDDVEMIVHMIESEELTKIGCFTSCMPSFLSRNKSQSETNNVELLNIKKAKITNLNLEICELIKIIQELQELVDFLKSKLA